MPRTIFCSNKNLNAKSKSVYVCDFGFIRLFAILQYTTEVHTIQIYKHTHAHIQNSTIAIEEKMKIYKHNGILTVAF